MGTSHARRVLAATAVAVAAAAVVPSLAGAEGAGGMCHATNGNSAYHFEGTIEFVPNNAYSVRADRYTARFTATDDNPDNIPADAKNDVYLQIRRFDNNEVLRSTHSPDDMDYFVPYTHQLDNWTLPRGVTMYGKFTPWFDKRYTPDVSCTADTQPFIYDMPSGTWQLVCDKTDGTPCRVINPG